MPSPSISFISAMILIHYNDVVKTQLLYYSVTIMNVLKQSKRSQVIAALVEGASSIVRRVE